MRLGYNFYRPEHFVDYQEKIDRLHDVGVRSAAFIFAIQPHTDKIVNPWKPRPRYVNFATEANIPKAVQYVQDLGWEVTIKPHFHSLNRDDLGRLKWWSGFCKFRGTEATRFEELNIALLTYLTQRFQPDTICIENELMQMLYMDAMWHRIINSLPDTIRTTVALNFFQPYKVHELWTNWLVNRYGITPSTAKSFIKNYGFEPQIVDGVDFRLFKRGKPQWIDAVDEVGFNAYWFPTMMDDTMSVDKIMHMYRCHSFYHRVRIWFWSTRYHVVTNYIRLLERYAGDQDWRVTEIDAIAGPVKQNKDAYKRWWEATFNVFSQTNCQVLTVWDDRSWGWWIDMMEERSAWV